MSRPDRLKDRHGKGNSVSLDINVEDSAARTRPFSFEKIMLRRRNKECIGNVKDPAKEACDMAFEGSSKKIADHFESANSYKHDKIPSLSMDKHYTEELVNIGSRKKLKSIYVKEDDSTEGRDRTNIISDTKSRAGLKNKGKITKETAGKEMCDWRKNEQKSDNSEYKAGHKHSRDPVNKDNYAEKHRPKTERKSKKKDHIEEDENPNKYHAKRKHDKDRHDGWKVKERLSNGSEEVPEKKRHRGSDKDKHVEDKAKYEREIKRKYRNGDDETQNRNAIRKEDLGKLPILPIYDGKTRREKEKSHYEELTRKRRSRSRDCVDRRRSPSFSPRAHRNTYHDGERKELSVVSLNDSSRKKHSNVDRNRASTNGSSSHHRRHRQDGSASGLGGYSPRKRKSETDAKIPSPSKHSPEKKRAGWDLPPVGADNPSSASVSSGFQLSNYGVLSHMHDVASATSLDPVKPLPLSFFNAVSTGKNANVDSVQLTQATRPMRRLYLENLPASASEKVLMDCFNSLLLSASVNRIQQTQPCISCIIHKDRGQALVEFLTAEDASAALSFDGSTMFGSLVKIRRPKDYVEVATGEPERSVDVADTNTINDVVIDSSNKIFIGGISNHISSEMLMEIASAFGPLKAYHFEARFCGGSCAFLEYVDHSVTSKACAGLNGMKLGGEVLTVVPAMPDALPLENDGKPPSYEIPDHAKPLLRTPTQVLEIKNVFTVESISSLSDTAIEEILEDVRLECARFGTVKSINAVKHSSDENLANKLEDCEVKNGVDSKEASLDSHFVTNAEPSFSEATHSMSKGKSGVEFDYDKELEEDKENNGSSVNVDKNADKVSDNTACQEHIVSDTTVKDAGDKSIQGSPDRQDTTIDEPDLQENIIANDDGVDVEDKTVDGNMDSKNPICPSPEGFPGRDTSSELVGPRKDINEEDDICNHVFEPGSVLIEYARTEACCLAAHCLHGRFFDDKKATVEYVPLSLYKARFTK